MSNALKHHTKVSHELFSGDHFRLSRQLHLKNRDRLLTVHTLHAYNDLKTCPRNSQTNTSASSHGTPSSTCFLLFHNMCYQYFTVIRNSVYTVMSLLLGQWIVYSKYWYHSLQCISYIYLHNTVQKFWVGKIFYVFKEALSSLRLHLCN